MCSGFLSMKAYVLSLSVFLSVSFSAQAADDLSALGEVLFFDANLSKNRTQACASCHAPDKAFSDPRETPTSTGDDGVSVGSRNAPALTYATKTVPFHLEQDGHYAGGFFLDGRAETLAEQAGGPPLNPVEMGMPSKAAVVQRLKENSFYVRQFETLGGKGILNSPDKAFSLMTKSLEAFQESDRFSTFDSKYDRHLRGEYTMTPQEELGMTLFFSDQFTNCHHCHKLNGMPNTEGETFSNYQFHNIGVPANTELGLTAADVGLLNHPKIKDDAQKGKFKTPSLRNVAVTDPYMHNGVFKDLRTVVLFYNKYNSKSQKSQINPETKKQWDSPETEQNIAIDLLEKGNALKTRRVDALVAFMKTLTDKRYEHLIVD